MDKQTTKERIDYLRALIQRADLAYDAGQQFMSDLEYDKLYAELVNLEQENPEFFDLNSPTQKINAVKVEGLEEVHYGNDVFLGSEDKVYTEEDIREFASRSTSPIEAEFKEDGLTVYLTYDKGELQLGSTRGGNETGENVTHSIRTIRNLPKIIPFGKKLEVRVEAIIPFKEFERINDELLAQGVPEEKLFKSPRNLASGTVRQLDSKVAKQRRMVAYAFNLMSAEGMTFKDGVEQLEFLKEQGFTVDPYRVFENTPEGIDALVKYCLEFNDTVRGTLDHAIDGLVLKFTDLSVRETLGYTTKCPRWSTAFKFTSLKAPTKIRKIVHEVGKLGQITPVAELKPVNIEVTIRRATLHNYFKIQERDIREGDTVVVERAGDVIPHISESIASERTGNEVIIVPPSTCPSCGAKTEFDGKNLFCTGVDCYPQLEGKLIHFETKGAMNIDGLGKETIRLLLEQGFIRSFSDIYQLAEHKDEIIVLNKFGKRKYEKMMAGIEASKSSPLHKVLFALSIRHIGESTSKDFAKNFKDMNEILELAKDPTAFQAKIIALKGFGEEMTTSLINFFTSSVNVELIKKLMSLGLTMKSDNATTQGNVLEGKVFVITGDLSKPRDTFEKLIENMGGKVTGSISKNSNFLLMGSNANGTTKHKNALKLGIPILDEEMFNQLIS